MVRIETQSLNSEKMLPPPEIPRNAIKIGGWFAR